MRFRRNYNRFRDSVCILGKNDAEQNPSHKCAVIRRISFSEKAADSERLPLYIFIINILIPVRVSAESVFSNISIVR